MSKINKYSSLTRIPKYTYLLVRFEAIEMCCENTEECRVIAAYSYQEQADFVRDQYNYEAEKHKSPYTYASIKVKIKRPQSRLFTKI